MTVIITVTQEQLDDMEKAAFQRGYSDGLGDGYDDGYRDGFDEGVYYARVENPTVTINN